MLGQSLNEQSAIETLVDNLVEQHHDVCHLINNREVDDLEVVLRVEHVQVFYHLLVSDVALTEGYCLVEDAQSITHTAIGLLGNHCQCLFLVGDALLLSHRLQVVDGVADGHALEVVNLATTQDGWKNLMFLRCSEDEDDVCGRLFQRLQEGVESCCRQHVNLINDKHLVLANLRRDARLLHQRLDVLHAVVRGSIELKDVKRALFVERLTRLTLSASLTVLRGRHTVDGLRKDACAGGLTHTTRSAEEVGMSQFSALDGVLQRRGQCLLSHHRVKRRWPVFSGRNNIFFHNILRL